MPWRTALFLALSLAAPARALEPWADRTLPVDDGLVLWLDVARQPAARKAHDLPVLVPRALVGVCYDGSGNRLHLIQRLQSAQPHFIQAGKHAVLRFDGKSRYVDVGNIRRRLDDFTLFIVAAPRSNAGDFRGLIAGNEIGKRDYTSGFTVDMTHEASSRFDRVNVEGKGFVGAVNLLPAAYPLGEFRTIEVICTSGAKGVQLVIDGKPAGSRARQPGRMVLDEITVGARFYTNEPTPACVRGFFDGDIAEVLLFDRLLTAAQRDKVRAYLARKHAGLTRAMADSVEPRPRTVAKPPPVQVLLPGFAVRQLPVDLPNINNVKYRSDGKLVALAYNGDVYLLSDSDGDGVENRAELYWDNKGRIRSPIGMALTPPGFKHGQGVLIASKGKVSLLVDAKDGKKAEKEVIVASGWKELSHNVDALGAAVGKDGSVYFGLGTADFTNAYQVQGGKARYDLKSERGTILAVAPDFKSRKIVATGIRFPVALAFNRRGDLFATDQEGATWLPNGNPFDELLHIQPGRHYGFPPRHPRHLPGVIDEPSVYDYGPQHQSTCGLNFNEPVNGGPVFGPKHWAGDALVSGYSRGKLYRTQLAHTPAGYVARNHLLACLNMLTVDACVSPKGDVVVAVHSGMPDWGNGPGGKGRLYKISYVGKSLPQPVAAWPAGPRELRISFDRPVPPALVRDLASKAFIEYGPFVRAGDRFEVLRPGYAVVAMQQQAPPRRLPVHSARLIDGHTLSLLTAPHPGAVHYAVTLPGLGRPEKPGKGELPQHAEVDLDYDLSGVEATWQPATGKESWSGFLPHLDPEVSRQLLAGSLAHAELWPALEQRGTLTARTKLDLWQMLRPAVQPGSTLDHTWPVEKVTLVVESVAPFTLKSAGKSIAATREKDRHIVRLEHVAKEGETLPIEVVLKKGKGAANLRISFFTNEDKRLRALPLRRVLLPWAAVKPAEVAVMPRPAELEGGNFLRGRRVFYSEDATCGKCHAIRGEGGKIGPDLSNLVHRDYQSVLKDIREPSAALNPDHIAYTFELDDGRILFGVPRDAGGGKLIIADQTGREIVVRRDRIEKVTASKVSLMPEGLDRALGPAKMRDLMTFLLTEPLTPAPIERDGPPPPRSRAEMAAAWKSVKAVQGPVRRLRVLLAAGPKDHGPGEHDYPLWQRRWFNLLSLGDNVAVEMVMGWPGAARLAKTDVVVFYSNNPGWSKERAKELEAFLARGGGAVYLHWAVNGHRAVDELARNIGLVWGAGSKFRHGPLELTFPDAKHPITRGLSKLKLIDESYWRLAGDVKGVTVLATGVEEGKAQPLMWTRTQGKGRVFVSIPGHYNWSFNDPLFRLIVLRGLCWTAGEEVDRLSELATVGARIGD
jgi:putative heme-binding domain-containing protein